MPNTVLDANQQARKQHRQRLKQLRRRLNAAEQRTVALAVTKQFLTSPFSLRCGRIGSYLAGMGELDLTLVHHNLWARQQTLAVPTVRGQTLEFFQLHSHTRLVRNRFGLAEPAAGAHYVDTRSLSLLLMPLVAFDKQGNRLGMGGGFYDRHLARLPGPLRPTLIGVGHDFQEVDRLPVESWDIPLDGLLTPSRWQWF